MALENEITRVAGGAKDTLKALITKLGGTVGDERIDQYSVLAGGATKPGKWDKGILLDGGTLKDVAGNDISADVKSALNLGAYQFSINDDGDLILTYIGDRAPNYSINEDGDLIMTSESGGTINLGHVRGGSGDSIDVTGAKVGQTIKIKAVDTDGKPTAWEAVDAPSGGETWELIASGEMQETAKLNITKDNNGLPFSLKSAQIFVRGDISVPKSSTMRVSAERFASIKDYDSYSVEVSFGKDNPKVNLWYVLREKTMPMLFWEVAGVDWQSADCQVLMGVHRHFTATENVYGKDLLNHLINRVSIGQYMGTGNMAAGCKYEIWGVRA